MPYLIFFNLIVPNQYTLVVLIPVFLMKWSIILNSQLISFLWNVWLRCPFLLDHFYSLKLCVLLIIYTLLIFELASFDIRGLFWYYSSFHCNLIIYLSVIFSNLKSVYELALFKRMFSFKHIHLSCSFSTMEKTMFSLEHICLFPHISF